MSATVVAERQVVVPFKPSPRLEKQMRTCRREDSRLAAMLLLAYPERIGSKAVEDFLMEVRFIRREMVTEWLNRAGIKNHRMPADQLYRDERERIVSVLVQHLRATEAAA